MSTRHRLLARSALGPARGRQLDRDYLRRWAAELRVSETLERLLSEADERGPANE
jgi:CRP-like cAMP-binding protein